MASSSGIARWTVANQKWLSIIAGALSALLFSIYTGVATAATPTGTSTGVVALAERLAGLGAGNLIAVLAVLSLAVQVVLARAGARSRRRLQQAEAEQLSSALLEGVIGLLQTRHPEAIYRSLVAIADKKAGTRTAICGANIRTDPELHLSKPIDFGVAGEAFMSRSPRAADLDDTNRDLGRDGKRVAGIWKETRCVLAFPMVTDDNVAFGTVNFDSNKTLAESDLGDRRVQIALSRVSDVITYLMRSHSDSGDVAIPH
jgi:hypothetical protein